MKSPGPKQLDLFADVPRGIGTSGRPKRPLLDEARLEMKLAGAHQRVRNLVVLGMRSGDARSRAQTGEFDPGRGQGAHPGARALSGTARLEAAITRGESLCRPPLSSRPWA
jgi:hypothetical protein